VFANDTLIGRNDAEHNIPAPATPEGIESEDARVMLIADGTMVVMVIEQLPERTVAVMVALPGVSGAVQTNVTACVADVGVPALALQSAASTAVNSTFSNSPTVVRVSAVPSGALSRVRLVSEQGGGGGVAGAGVVAPTAVGSPISIESI
jgi:hypothetical protein